MSSWSFSLSVSMTLSMYPAIGDLYDSGAFLNEAGADAVPGLKLLSLALVGVCLLM